MGDVFFIYHYLHHTLCGISLLMTPKLLELLMAVTVTPRAEREGGSIFLDFINNNNENNSDSIYKSNNQHIL